MKEIKDYLHLYLGCDIFTPAQEEGQKDDIWRLTPSKLQNWLDGGIWSRSGAKLLLRPLSDMTEEEMREFINWNKLNEMYVDVSFVREKTGIVINYGVDVMDYVEKLSHKITFTEWSPNEFLWMLRNSFDLFGLIESGLAIDKTAIEEVKIKKVK